MDLASFKQHTKSFLQHIAVEKNLAANTRRAYTSDLEQFIEFWDRITQDNSPLPMATVLERFFVSLYHQKINKSSIARKLSCFKSFEKYLRIAGVEFKINLARPRLDKKLPVYLSVDEIFYLLDSIKHEDLPTKKPLRDKAVLELLYATGVRCAELVGIKIGDINVDQKCVRVYGKGRKERMALFGERAKKSILEFIQKERGPVTSLNDPLFNSFKNKPLTTRSVQRIIGMFRNVLNTGRPISPHKIRHSFATHMLHQGVDLRVVQELLGHASLSSTEKYTHVSSQQLAAMCDTLHPIHKMIKNNK